MAATGFEDVEILVVDRDASGNQVLGFDESRAATTKLLLLALGE